MKIYKKKSTTYQHLPCKISFGNYHPFWRSKATKCASLRKFFVVLIQNGWEFQNILVCVRKLTYPATLATKFIIICRF